MGLGKRPSTERKCVFFKEQQQQDSQRTEQCSRGRRQERGQPSEKPQEEFGFYKENEQKILAMRPELHFKRTVLATAV